MNAKSTLADKGVAVFETELELLVDQYRGAPACLPPQRIAVRRQGFIPVSDNQNSR